MWILIDHNHFTHLPPKGTELLMRFFILLCYSQRPLDTLITQEFLSSTNCNA